MYLNNCLTLNELQKNSIKTGQSIAIKEQQATCSTCLKLQLRDFQPFPGMTKVPKQFVFDNDAQFQTFIAILVMNASVVSRIIN